MSRRPIEYEPPPCCSVCGNLEGHDKNCTEREKPKLYEIPGELVIKQRAWDLAAEPTSDRTVATAYGLNMFNLIPSLGPTMERFAEAGRLFSARVEETILQGARRLASLHGLGDQPRKPAPGTLDYLRNRLNAYAIYNDDKVRWISVDPFMEPGKIFIHVNITPQAEPSTIGGHLNGILERGRPINTAVQIIFHNDKGELMIYVHSVTR